LDASSLLPVGVVMGGRWRRLRAGVALGVALAIVSNPVTSGALVAPPIPGAVTCIEYVLYCGPGGQLLEDTLSADVAAGLPSLGALGLLGIASTLFMSGDSAPTQLIVQNCVDKINAHGGFPQFTGAGFLPGAQTAADCPAVALLEYGVYSAAEIENLMPWERQFCAAVYSGAGNSWTAFTTGNGFPSGLQALVDIACPVPWRPFILGTAPSPLTGGVVDPAASLQTTVPDTTGYQRVGFCNMVTSALASGVEQTIQVACSFAPSSALSVYEVVLQVYGHQGVTFRQGWCDNNPGYYSGSGCGWTSPAAGQLRFFGTYTNHYFGDWTVGHNTLGLAPSMTTQALIYSDYVTDGFVDLNIALGTSAPAMPSQYWTTVPTTPATVLPAITIAPLTTVAPPVTVAPAPSPATMPAVGASPDGNTGTSWLGSTISTVIGVMTAGLTAALSTVENVMRWVGSLLQTLQSNLLAGITWMVNSLLDILQQILAAVQAVGAAIGSLADVVVQAVNAVAAPIVAAVVAAAVAIVAAVTGLASAVATAVATQLQTLFVPDGTEVSTQVDSMNSHLAPTIVGTAVASAGGLVTAISNGASGGVAGGACGPSIGFDSITAPGVTMPAFHIWLPAGPGCPGNAPGGGQSSWDTDAWGLHGYLSLVRGLEGFALVWVFFWGVIGAAPWSGKSETVGVGSTSAIPLGVEESTASYVGRGRREIDGYLRKH
jgi:hypothetical protein